MFCNTVEIETVEIEPEGKEYWPLSKEELIAITKSLQDLQKENGIQKQLIDAYEIQILNYKGLVKIDSLEIELKDMKIKTLEEIVELQKPTFWESLTDNKYFGFILGVAVTIGAG